MTCACTYNYEALQLKFNAAKLRLLHQSLVLQISITPKLTCCLSNLGEKKI